MKETVKNFIESIPSFLFKFDILYYSFIALGIGIFVVVLTQYILKKKTNKKLSPIAGFISVLFIVLFVIHWRAFFDGQTVGICSIFNNLFKTLFETTRVFFFNGDAKALIQNYSHLERIETIIYILYFFAPFTTITAIVSSFVDFLKIFSINCRRFIGVRKIYVFSELNEMSIILARDIYKKNRCNKIYFCDVFEANTENYYELKEDANSINATCLKQDISTVNFKKRSLLGILFKSNVNYFLLSDNENENFNQAVNLIQSYPEEKTKADKARNTQSNDNIYIFSTKTNYQILNDKYYKKKINIRPRNTAESFIFSYANENGNKILSTAKEERIEYYNEHRTLKIVDVLILGLGTYGSEMFKLLTWLCQIDGYGIRIHAFDQNPNVKNNFELMYPGLLSKENNHFFNNIGPQYEINIHSGVDVNSNEFKNKLDEIYKNSVPTYAFVSLGDDERNRKCAKNLDRIFYQRYSIGKADESLSRIKRIDAVIHNNRSCEIYQCDSFNCIGNYNGIYSYNNIINYEVENQGKMIHINRGYPEEEFWSNSYNYRSSIAEVFYKNVRNKIIDFESLQAVSYDEETKIEVIGNESTNTVYITNENAKALSSIDADANAFLSYAKIIEHNRWCAYLLTEGFVTCESKQKKNNNKRAHHQIRSFVDINELTGEATPHFCSVQKSCYYNISYSQRKIYDRLLELASNESADIKQISENKNTIEALKALEIDYPNLMKKDEKYILSDDVFDRNTCPNIKINTIPFNDCQTKLGKILLAKEWLIKNTKLDYLGISKAFQYLMHKNDIPCTLVCGEDNEVWNTVELNGKCYSIDLLSSTHNTIENCLCDVYKNGNIINASKESHLIIGLDFIEKMPIKEDENMYSVCFYNPKTNNIDKFVIKYGLKDFLSNEIKVLKKLIETKETEIIPNVDFLNVSNDPNSYIIFKDSKRTLKKYLFEIENHLSNSKKVDLIKKLCQPIITCEKNGIIHGDINPENFAVFNKQWCLINFHNSAILAENDTCKYSNVEYSSPEIYKENKLDKSTDLYSFALIVYYILSDCNKPEWNAKNRTKYSDINEISGFTNVCKVLRKALSYKAEERYHSFSAFYKELDKAFEKDQHS